MVVLGGGAYSYECGTPVACPYDTRFHMEGVDRVEGVLEGRESCGAMYANR